MSIQRIDSNNRMSQLVVYNGIAYLAGQVDETSVIGRPAGEQTVNILKQIDAYLAKAGTDKTKLLTTTIYLANIADFAAMNAAWQAWVSPQGLPTRATVEAKLAAPEYTVEIVITAAI
jgi:enamine deaminase RidA (YjgF/YER057c/UK114 family)